MKKIGFIFLIIIVCIQTYAQKTVYGKYKGKSVKLVYFEGDPDIIKSIEYERVGDLEKENSNLQSQIAIKNKKISELQSTSTAGGTNFNKAQIDSLSLLIKKLQTDKDKLSSDIKNNNIEINKLKLSVQPLNDSLAQANIVRKNLHLKISDLESKNSNLENQITEKNKKIKELQTAAIKPDANKELIESLNKQIEKLQTEKDKLSSDINKNNLELTKLKGSVQPLNDSLFQSNLAKKGLIVKVSDLETKNKNLINQIVEKDKKIKELQAASIKPDSNKELIVSLNNQIEKLQTEKDKLTLDISKNNIEINKLKGSIPPLNDSLVQANLVKKGLQSKVNDLETKNKNLTNQIAEKDKKIKEIQDKSKTTDLAKEQIATLNSEIEILKAEKANLTSESERNIIEINKLKESSQITKDSLKLANNEIKILKNNLKFSGRDNYRTAPSIAISYFTGIPFIFNNLLKNGIWDKKNSLSNQFNLIYEQPLGSISLGVGIGITNYRLKAGFSNYEETINGLSDIDNDTYNAICFYKDIKEDVSLLYLDIPIMLSFGQPRVNRIGAYGKLGVTASINVQNKFNGEGKYNISGYYPNWDIIIHDVDELNFKSDASSYENAEYEVNRFVLWGNISGGVYLPLSNIRKGQDARFILKLGAKCDYSIMTISKELDELYKGAHYHIKQSNILSGKGTRILSPGLEVAFIFMLTKPK